MPSEHPGTSLALRRHGSDDYWLRRALGVSCIRILPCGLMCIAQLYYMIVHDAASATGMVRCALPERS